MMNYLIDLTTWLSEIVSIIALPLLGIVGTLMGVIVANRASTKNLRLSLENASAEKKIDRKNDLRREIYLDFIEKMSFLAAYVGTLNTVNIGKVNVFSETQGFFSAAAKVALISENETSLLVTKLSTSHGELLLDIVLHMRTHSDLLSALEHLDEMSRNNETEIQRILSEISHVIEAANYDEVRHQKLNASFDFFAERTQTFIAERGELNKQYKASMIDFNQYLFKAIEPLRPLGLEVAVALRMELGIDTNIDDFRQMHNESASRVALKIEELHEAIRN